MPRRENKTSEDLPHRKEKEENETKCLVQAIGYILRRGLKVESDLSLSSLI